MRLETVDFKRTKLSPRERGVMVNEGDGPLIDMDGNIVKAPVYNWWARNESVMFVPSPTEEP